MKLDQVSKDLLAAARRIEKHGLPPYDSHALRSLSMVLQTSRGIWRRGSADFRARYYAAANRFHNACGIDNMDLSPEEAIDSLVAAAFWEAA